MNVISSIDFESTAAVTNVLTYIGGYLVHKIHDLDFSCDYCMRALVTRDKCSRRRTDVHASESVIMTRVHLWFDCTISTTCAHLKQGEQHFHYTLVICLPAVVF